MMTVFASAAAWAILLFDVAAAAVFELLDRFGKEHPEPLDEAMRKWPWFFEQER